MDMYGRHLARTLTALALVGTLLAGTAAADIPDADGDGAPDDVERLCMDMTVREAIGQSSTAGHPVGTCTPVQAPFDLQKYPWCASTSDCWQYVPPTPVDQSYATSLIVSKDVTYDDADGDGVPGVVRIPQTRVSVHVSVVSGEPATYSIASDPAGEITVPVDPDPNDPDDPADPGPHESELLFRPTGASSVAGGDADGDGFAKYLVVDLEGFVVVADAAVDLPVWIESRPYVAPDNLLTEEPLNWVPFDPDDGNANVPVPDPNDPEGDGYSNGEELLAPPYLDVVPILSDAVLDLDTLNAAPMAYLVGLQDAALHSLSILGQAAYFADERNLADADDDGYTNGFEKASRTDPNDPRSHPNRPPALDAVADVTGAEGAALTITIVAHDLDGPDDVDDAVLTLAVDGLPGTVSYDPTETTDDAGDAEFMLSWTPSFTEEGTYSVTVSVSDDGHDDRAGTRFGALASEEDAFTVVIAHTNAPPTIQTASLAAATEDAAYSATVTADDTDDDTVTFSKSSGPAWLAVSAAGALSGTPANADVTAGASVVIAASDGTATATQTYTLQVANTNDPPVVGALADVSTSETQTVTFTVTFTDEDVGDTATRSIAGKPDAATFDAGTGAFSWTTGYHDAGAHALTFTATDAAGAYDTEEVTITVANTNSPPTLGAVGNKNVAEDQTLSFAVTATDTDAAAQGNELTFAADTLPAGATLDASSGAFSWKPGFTQAGTYPVTFRVDDGDGGSDTEAITITVTNVNRAPVFGTTSLPDATEDAAYTETLTASDDDGQTPTFSKVSGAPWLTVASNGALSGTPADVNWGTNTVTFRVTDGEANVDTTIDLEVARVDDAPVIAGPTTHAADEGEPISISVTASDEEGADLAFTLGTGAPDWLALDEATPNTATLSGTPGFQDSGSYTVTVTVEDDGGNTDALAIALVVGELNRVPVVTALDAPADGADRLIASRTDGRDVVAFSVEATDPDGDALTFSLDLGDGTTVAAASYEHRYVSPGTYTLVATVTDARGAFTTTDAISVDVYDPTEDDDGDGLTNEEEVTGSANEGYDRQPTDPALADTDGDGTDDKAEIDAGSDPNRTRATVCDADGDGLPNALETSDTRQDLDRPVPGGLPVSVTCDLQVVNYLEIEQDDADVLVYVDQDDDGEYDEDIDDVVLSTEATAFTADEIVRCVGGPGAHSEDATAEVVCGVLAENGATCDAPAATCTVTTRYVEYDIQGDLQTPPAGQDLVLVGVDTIESTGAASGAEKGPVGSHRIRLCVSANPLRTVGCLNDTDGDGWNLIDEAVDCSDPTEPDESPEPTPLDQCFPFRRGLNASTFAQSIASDVQS